MISLRLISHTLPCCSGLRTVSEVGAVMHSVSHSDNHKASHRSLCTIMDSSTNNALRRNNLSRHTHWTPHPLEAKPIRQKQGQVWDNLCCVVAETRIRTCYACHHWQSLRPRRLKEVEEGTAVHRIHYPASATQLVCTWPCLVGVFIYSQCVDHECRLLPSKLWRFRSWYTVGLDWTAFFVCL